MSPHTNLITSMIESGILYWRSGNQHAVSALKGLYPPMKLQIMNRESLHIFSLKTNLVHPRIHFFIFLGEGGKGKKELLAP